MSGDATPPTTLRAVAITTLVITVAAAFVLASEIILILFLGVLFAVFLCKTAGLVTRHVPLGYGGSLAAVVVVLIALTGGSSVFFFVQINRQIDDASDKVDEGLKAMARLTQRYPALRSAVRSVPFLPADIRPGESPNRTPQVDSPQKESESRPSPDNGITPPSSDLSTIPAPVKQAASTIGRLFRTTFGLAINSLLIFFVGLFLAASPRTYRDGAVRLIPNSRRQRVSDVLDSIGDALARWLLGRFLSMFVTGLGAFLLLAVLDVPMAGTLGIVTALLTFVPNIGAAIALMLAILVALPQGLATVGMVLAGYVAFQLLESYVVTPLIQQRQVELPPALLIAFQAIMGVLFGFIGAAVASPLLVTGKTAIEMLYVEDYLGEEPSQKSSCGGSVSP